jgi:hypothetical protein
MQLRSMLANSKATQSGHAAVHGGDRQPAEVRTQLLSAIYAGQTFRTALCGLGLTTNEAWRLTKTDQEWAEALEAALVATRRNNLTL